MTSRELDFWIAEKVIGIVFEDNQSGFRQVGETVYLHPDDCPEYSTDIEAAWEVVEKLSPRIIVGPSPWKKGEYTATYNAYDGYADGFDWVSAETAPMAICLAALEVKEKGIEP